MDIRSKSDLEKLLEDLKKIVDLDNIVCTNWYLRDDARNAWNNVEISDLPVDETCGNDLRLRVFGRGLDHHPNTMAGLPMYLREKGRSKIGVYITYLNSARINGLDRSYGM